jgi:hydroxyacylglutathione hydrolase
MHVLPVACLKDNYAYLVVDDATKTAAVVDPSEAEPVASAAERAGVKLVAIWNTHHHFDHVGGNEELVKRFGIDEVCAHASDKGRVPGQTRMLNEGDHVRLDGKLRAEILHIPGHTLGAIAYVIEGCVFTGDTLFVAGCGRLFEGTPAMMFESLGKLARLPDATKVYCGHEYTESNLRFAAHVEPNNPEVAAWRERAKKTREAGAPTVPGTIGHEKKINPFVRAKSVEELAERRKAKDSF